MGGPPLVATYRREVGASLARIWENVLDWEHLPWLHRTTFRDVRLRDASPQHWTGWIATRDGSESLIDTRLDRPNLRYLVKTVDGAGLGTEILTELEERAKHRTGIRVSFRIPGIDASRAARVGVAFVKLYERLWDEDEGMMQERQRALDRTQPRAFRTVDVGGRRLAFSTVCPHLGGPLAEAGVVDGIVTCPWHGYRFDVTTGRNLDGKPCVLELGDSR